VLAGLLACDAKADCWSFRLSSILEGRDWERAAMGGEAEMGFDDVRWV
jgi:hypothetical protein